MNSLYMLVRELDIVNRGFDILVSISFKDPFGDEWYYVTYDTIW